ncbi:MAG: P1 family peptidase [Sumerlaeia bacterium]
MRITFAYNLRKEKDEGSAENLLQEDVDRIGGGLESLGHKVTPLEVTLPPRELVQALQESRPDLIFNAAEGQGGTAREAYYPAIYRQLHLPHTGSGPSVLLVDLDKRLSEEVLHAAGVRVPRGALIREKAEELSEDLDYPLFIKPNYEGSSKGISAKSVAETPKEALALIEKLLKEYPEGVCVEEFIPGRELTVPMLEAFPGHMLEVVENRFIGTGEYNIYDYELKQGEGGGHVETDCPAKLTARQRQDVMAMADRIFSSLPCHDVGRADFRMREDGRVYLIERNPLPSLHPQGSLMKAGRARELAYEEVLDLIVRSAARRYRLSLATEPFLSVDVPPDERKGARELGLRIGRFDRGQWNSITDVDGIAVGHVTHIADGVDSPGNGKKTTSIRSGVTAIVPNKDDLFTNHLPCGGFVLNGIGEMSGLIQAMEWGWMETPVLLTNTMSIGHVHAGVIEHMVATHPELARKVGVMIPIVAETNDSFLNDTMVPSVKPEDAVEAIRDARTGPVRQGSVGGGTGMTTFDFAGGIGSASRVLPEELGGHTVGVLVQSNFGHMKNLTVEGRVIGKDLDPLYPTEPRRGRSYGSVIVIVATDAPMHSQQLQRLSKRAALGLGRAGSSARTTSGEIVFAFSTGNRTPRNRMCESRYVSMTFVADEYLNGLYEATIEATEEAVLNAMLYSAGMNGQEGRYCWPIPTDKVVELLGLRMPDESGPQALHG